MDIRVLNYFLTVAREENITKAAALLHLTQPTLSRQLMQLEDELGVKLFIRTNHNITLSEEGKIFERRAGEIVALAKKAQDELNAGAEISGEISIGSGEYAGSSLLAEIITGFHRKYPAVKAEIFSGNSDGIKERIERGLLDAGLLLEPVDISRYEFLRFPGKEVWGALVANGSPLAGKSELTPEDLAGEPLIFSGRELIKNELRNWFGPLAENLDIVASGNLPFNLGQLAGKGLGIFFTLQADRTYGNVKFIPLSPPLEGKLVLAWKKNESLSPAVSAFLSFARNFLSGYTNSEYKLI